MEGTWYLLILFVQILPIILIILIKPSDAEKYGDSQPGRNFGEAIKICFTKYFDFSGRAPRSEYWFWTLFVTPVSIILSAAGAASPQLYGLYILFSLGVLVPGIAVVVRRLHDRGRSGWWFLVGLLPITGSVILFVWMCLGARDTSSVVLNSQMQRKSSISNVEILERLQKLKESGAISAEEFELEKSKIVALK